MINRYTIHILAIAMSLPFVPMAAAEGARIHIVGSSTVYPFATLVAERFGRSKRYRTPTIEATGSGGGLKLFCSGVRGNTPDITNASRRMKASEFELCRRNNVGAVVEVKFGYDGVVIANSNKSGRISISRRELYLALAKDVPDPSGGQRFVPNPYRRWSDVNSALPAIPIRVLGPPPTSGTRDAFVELAMEGGCKQFPHIEALRKKNKSAYKARCHSVREDGAWIEAGENDNLIIQKLVVDPQAFGIFGFSFLKENLDKVQGALVESMAPSFENIASGAYPVSRSLYFYVKKAHIDTVPGIQRYMRMFVAGQAVGEDGYLVERGLIPLPPEEPAAVSQHRERVDSLALALDRLPCCCPQVTVAIAVAHGAGLAAVVLCEIYSGGISAK